MQIEGSTFLVTGGGSGLGAACARGLAGLGAQVVIADVATEPAEALALELGETARFVRSDVTDATQVAAAVETCVALSPGSFRGVVNCAGIVIGARVLGKSSPHSLKLFSNVVQVNLVGTFNVIRLAAEALIKSEVGPTAERGVIINTASVAAFDGQIGQAAYSASKGGVAAMTLPIARELARHGVRVVAIAPGLFNTPMMNAFPEQVRESLAGQCLFPARFGQPDEFAALVRHIIENPMLNGELIRLDGGVRLPSR